MKETVILDTGPLAACLSKTDQHHDWAVEQFGRLPPRVVTCEAVLTEACFLYSRAGGDPAGIIRKVGAGFLEIGFSVTTEAAAIERLLKRYRDTPMALADACVVRLSELHSSCRVLTCDGDFRYYRRFGRSVIPLLAPWG